MSKLLNVYYCVNQERLRLTEKFGASPFSDKADLLILLEQHRESEAGIARARGSIAYSIDRNRADDDELTKKDSSTSAADIGTGQSLSYARRAIGEITALGRMRLEERKSSEKKEEDGAVQDSDVSSTTLSPADSDSATETRQSDGVADNTQSSTSVSPNSNASSSSGDALAAGSGPATDSPVSVEVACDKHITANDVDGIAVCLT